MQNNSLPLKAMKSAKMFELIDVQGVLLLKSDKLVSTHAFSTRVGGVSELDHTKSLNLAFGRGDDYETVLKNVEIFANALGIDGAKLISVPQVHSNDVKIVTDAEGGSGVTKKSPFSCDGYVTTEIGLPIGVKTADCVPILLEARDDNGEVIAVSAVHAGWRGTAEKIAAVAIEKLCALGAKVENIYVAIGPCIGECCYEVGKDFAEQIKEKLGQNYENKFIKQKENSSLFADLKGMNIEVLTSFGVPRNNIDVSEHCTCCHGELFYSHRAQKGIRGSLMSVIVK